MHLDLAHGATERHVLFGGEFRSAREQHAEPAQGRVDLRHAGRVERSRQVQAKDFSPECAGEPSKFHRAILPLPTSPVGPQAPIDGYRRA